MKISILSIRNSALLAVAIGGVLFLTGCQIPAELVLQNEATGSVQQTNPVGSENETGGEGIEVASLERPGFDSSGWEVFKTRIRESGGGGPKLKNTYTSVKTDQPVIAITFDDGPHRDNTPRLLDMLKERNIRATFYVVGNMVKYNPQILKRTVEEGHEIGNHTVTHNALSRMSSSGLRKELTEAHRMIVEVTGIAPRTMRPPGGAIKSAQKELMLREFGYPTILWSVDPEDWKKPGVSVVTRRLVEGARPGGILLVHDLHKSTVDAMPSTLDQLLAKGFKFVTVSELLAMDQHSN